MQGRRHEHGRGLNEIMGYDRVQPVHKKKEKFILKINKCRLLNYTAITSGYAGRNPQGGTVIEACG